MMHLQAEEGQGRRQPLETGRQEASFPGAFRKSRALRTPRFGLLASRAVSICLCCFESPGLSCFVMVTWATDRVADLGYS